MRLTIHAISAPAPRKRPGPRARRHETRRAERAEAWTRGPTCTFLPTMRHARRMPACGNVQLQVALQPPLHARGIFGDLIYVKKNNPNVNLRIWKAGSFIKNSFFKGWHPPHPSFFAKKSLFENYGYYDLINGNSADVELMFRFLETYQIKFIINYIDKFKFLFA